MCRLYHILLHGTALCSEARYAYILACKGSYVYVPINHSIHLWAHFIFYRMMISSLYALLWYWHNQYGISWHDSLGSPKFRARHGATCRGGQWCTHLLGKGVYVTSMLTAGHSTLGRNHSDPPTQLSGRKILLTPVYYYFNPKSLVFIHNLSHHQAHKTQDRCGHH